MSLPAGGPWPPPPHNVALAQQGIWSAWLAGDPKGLLAAYNEADTLSNPTGRAFFSREDGTYARRQGGIIPALSRFFWGRPSASGERRAKLHIPLAADIATASADMLFSEPPQFLIAGEEAKTQSKQSEHVDDYLNQGEFHAQLLEAAELVAGLGGGWLRLVWDKDFTDAVMIDAVAGDAAYGEWKFGRLQAVTFFTEYAVGDSKDEVLRHLERHEAGRILHGLYRGTKTELGHHESLEEHPDTMGIPVDEEGAIPTGVKGLTAAYVPNMRPSRTWRKFPQISELGRSDYDGVEALMDALDETYTSWMRDVRLAKARLIVPEYMLKDLGKGQGSAWDEEQEIYTKLNMQPSENAQITPQQFAIRVTEHRETADQLIDHILESAGYSPSTFGRGGEGMQTATEVVSRERQSERTRDKKTRYWSMALEPLLSTWLELDGIVYGRPFGGAAVAVKWPDASQPDQEALSRTVTALRQAEAATTDTLVRMLHPDWDEAQIGKEVAGIKAESGRDVPDVGPLPFDEE